MTQKDPIVISRRRALVFLVLGFVVFNLFPLGMVVGYRFGHAMGRLERSTECFGCACKP